MSTTVKRVVELEHPKLDANGLIEVPSVSCPVLATFDSVPPPEIIALADSDPRGPATKRARISCYCDTKHGGSLQLVAENQTLLFRGSPSAVTQLPRRTAVGIRNKKTGELVLVEVPSIAPLFKHVKAGSDDRSSEAQAGLSQDMSFADRRTLLAETFGTRKKMVQMRSSATNKLPETVVDVTEEQHAEAAKQVRAAVQEVLGKEEAEGEALLNADMPPFHADADAVQDVYLMEEVFPTSQWLSATTKAKELVPLLDTTAEGSTVQALHKAFVRVSGASSSFVGMELSRLYEGKIHKDDAEFALAVLLCMNQIIGFIVLNNASLRDNDSLIEATKRLDLNKTDVFALAAHFLDSRQLPDGKTKYSRSSVKDSKLVNTFLAGALYLEGWHVSSKQCADIAKDMKVYTDRIWGHLQRMGCVKHTTQGRVTYELKVPLNAVPESQRQRKKKAKKW